jgi:hypothetical protein
MAQMFEKLAALLAAAACLIVAILIWLSLSTYQPMWPLPGLYLVEMPALSIIGALAVVRGKPSSTLITWASAGAFGAFCALGVMSVGIFFLPAAVIFAVISITADARNKQRVAGHLGICLIAAIAQIALMLIAIRLT